MPCRECSARVTRLTVAPPATMEERRGTCPGCGRSWTWLPASHKARPEWPEKTISAGVEVAEASALPWRGPGPVGLWKLM